jgi:aminoglycoside phosphotransferase (APT) family kinase protein
MTSREMLEGNPLSTTQVAEIIRRQFPDVSITSVSYLGEGCDSSAFDVNAQWVFRFPKRGDVEEQLLLEFRVLPLLASHSPIPLPAFCFHGHPSAVFPRHFGGYPKLPGISGIQLDPETTPFAELAPVLAQFLSCLHAFPVQAAAGVGVPHGEVMSFIEEVRADAFDDFELLNKVAPTSPLEEWQAYLKTGPSAARVLSEPVVVHNDLGREHILCDLPTRGLTGIIDWSDITISDRLVDMAGLFHWGGAPFVDAVLSHYAGAIDEAALSCARYVAVCRGVADVAFGLETTRQEYIEAGIRALSLCASE